jgi:formate-dependent nitrite reductase membrane component NrfD
VIAGYGAVLAAHFLLARGGSAESLLVLAWLGAPLAAATAIYTAYLFAQAKARDLWQSPLLPVHLLVQSLLAGAATLLPLAAWLEPEAVPHLNLWLAGFCAAHLLLVAGETTLTHVTAHARLAMREMVWGRYRRWFWVGVLGTGLGLAAPVVGWPAGLAALAGLAAYVQAGQSVPLA